MLYRGAAGCVGEERSGRGLPRPQGNKQASRCQMGGGCLFRACLSDWNACASAQHWGQSRADGRGSECGASSAWPVAAWQPLRGVGTKQSRQSAHDSIARMQRLRCRGTHLTMNGCQSSCGRRRCDHRRRRRSHQLDRLLGGGGCLLAGRRSEILQGFEGQRSAVSADGGLLHLLLGQSSLAHLEQDGGHAGKLARGVRHVATGEPLFQMWGGS